MPAVGMVGSVLMQLSWSGGVGRQKFRDHGVGVGVGSEFVGERRRAHVADEDAIGGAIWRG